MTIVKPKALSEFKTPWESKGEDYDPVKGKAFIHYLNTQAWEQQEAAAKAAADLATVTTERDAFKTKVDEAARANETELERITRENTELKEKAAKADAPDLEKLRMKVAIKKGLDEDAMARLVGTNEEEMLADADKLLLNWKPAAKNDGDDDGSDDGDSSPVTRPKSKLQNPGDPNPAEGKFDADAAAADYTNRFGAIF